MSTPQSPESSVLSESSHVQTGPRFIEAVKTIIVQAFQNVFDEKYPDPQFQNMYVSMEYPALETQYPGLWIKFSFSKLQIVGISSFFFNENNQEYKQWYFEGSTTVQVFAMTSLARDRMSDALIYMFAFGDISNTENRFQNDLYSNQYISMSINSDQLVPGGQTEMIGAPWQEDAIVYNDSYTFQIVGQFASDPQGNFINLDSIQVNPSIDTSKIVGYDMGDGQERKWY